MLLIFYHTLFDTCPYNRKKEYAFTGCKITPIEKAPPVV